MSHPINIYDGDQMFRDMRGSIAVRLDRLEAQAIPVQAVALRDDILPGLINWYGYPIVRLAASSPLPWGVVT